MLRGKKNNPLRTVPSIVFLYILLYGSGAISIWSLYLCPVSRHLGVSPSSSFRCSEGICIHPSIYFFSTATSILYHPSAPLSFSCRCRHTIVCTVYYIIYDRPDELSAYRGEVGSIGRGDSRDGESDMKAKKEKEEKKNDSVTL